MASKKKAKEVVRKTRAGKDAALEGKATPKQTRTGKAKKAAASTKRSTKSKGRRKVQGVGVGKASEAGGTGEQGLDPFEAAKQRVKGSLPAIVEAMLELAKQGSCTHAKTLLEMTGAKHMFDGEAEGHSSGEPWAKLVLERLDEADCRAERESLSLQEERREEEVAVAE